MNFLLGGRTGDLIHALYVAKNTPGKHDLFITDRRDMHSDGFLLPLEETYQELLPVLSSQDYVNSFSIYNDEEAINLSMWRRYAYSASWTQLLANTFNVPVNGEPWIKSHKVAYWTDKTVFHCSHHSARRGEHWNIVTDNYKGVFIGTQLEYDTFGYSMEHYVPGSLIEMFMIINSCRFFIGNQSLPLAIAHSLGTQRLAILNDVDKIAYMGEEKFHKDFFWIAPNEHYFPGMAWIQ